MIIYSDQAEEYIKTILEYTLTNTKVFNEISSHTNLDPEELEAFLEEVTYTCEDVIIET